MQPVGIVERFIVVPFYGVLFGISRLVFVVPLVFFGMSFTPIAAAGVGIAAFVGIVISEV